MIKRTCAKMMKLFLTVPNDLILIISDYVHYEDNSWEDGVECKNKKELDLAVKLHLWVRYKKGMIEWKNFKTIKRLIADGIWMIYNCNLTHLKLTHNFDEDIIDHLTNSIKYLYIRGCKKTSIINGLYLPPKLHTLCLPDDYNMPIYEYPKKLKRFVSGEDFNQTIDNLPDSVEYIFLGESFNTDIHKLPKHLMTLSGTYFAVSIPPAPINNFRIEIPKRYAIHCKFPKYFKQFDLEVPFPTIIHPTLIISDYIKKYIDDENSLLYELSH